MNKSKKELAIKKLQTELKEEKQAEITRYVKFIQSPHGGCSQGF